MFFNEFQSIFVAYTIILFIVNFEQCPWTLSYSNNLRSWPLRSVVRFLSKVRNVLKRENTYFRFFNFYFSSYGENSSKIDHSLSTKMSIIRKIKIGKFWKKNSLKITHKRDMMWYDFFSTSLVSAHCASFMSRWPFLRGGGRETAYP